MKDGFVHLDFPNGPLGSVQGAGQAVDPYSFCSHDHAGCGRSTGT
jgi:hypothetical protein